MTDDEAARALGALGHAARLGVFRVLMQVGPDGVNTGALGRTLGMPASTLAHHLRALCDSGLLRQERRGRETINKADYDALTEVFAHVQDECCAGLPVAQMREEPR